MATPLRLFTSYRVDLAALLAVTIWGVSAPFRKAALAQFDVLPFTALRFLGMLVLGWGVLYWHWRVTREYSRIAPMDLPSLVLSGVCGYTVYLPSVSSDCTTPRPSPLLEAAHGEPDFDQHLLRLGACQSVLLALSDPRGVGSKRKAYTGLLASSAH